MRLWSGSGSGPGVSWGDTYLAAGACRLTVSWMTEWTQWRQLVSRRGMACLKWSEQSPQTGTLRAPDDDYEWWWCQHDSPNLKLTVWLVRYNIAAVYCTTLNIHIRFLMVCDVEEPSQLGIIWFQWNLADLCFCIIHSCLISHTANSIPTYCCIYLTTAD